MRTDRFYCPNLVPGSNVLSPEESHHAVSALRLKPGHTVLLFDGEGGEAVGEVVRATRKGVEVQAEGRVQHPYDAVMRVTIAVAMPRSHRQGVLIEKCTELGVEAIWPLLGERSVSKGAGESVSKWRRRAVEAAKQSGRRWVPVINAPTTLADCLAEASSFDSAVIAHTSEGAVSFSSVLAGCAAGGRVLAIVGPEGGWSDQEVRCAIDGGVVPVSLGQTILRTETAAIAICAMAGAAAGG